MKARTGPYAFANDVTRVGGKVTSKYVGILHVPERKRVDVIETGPSENVVETEIGTVVAETKAEKDIRSLGAEESQGCGAVCLCSQDAKVKKELCK